MKQILNLILILGCFFFETMKAQPIVLTSLDRFSCLFDQTMCQWQTNGHVDYSECGTRHKRDGPLCFFHFETNFIRLTGESKPINLYASVHQNDRKRNSTNQAFCIQSSVYIFSEQSNAYLKVYAKSSPESSEEIMYVKSEFNEDKWTPILVPLYSDTFEIRFETNVKSFYITSIVVNACPYVLNQKCTFEGPFKCPLLTYHHPVVTMQPATMSPSSLMPKTDVTLSSSQGHYLSVIWPLQDRDDSLLPNLISLLVKNQLVESNFLVNFFVNRALQSMDELSLIQIDINQRKRILWNSEQALELVLGTWSQVTIFGRCQSQCDLKFEWIHKASQSTTGSIAIDDIAIHTWFGENLYDNDFEQGFGLFTPHQTVASGSWLIGLGRVNNPSRLSLKPNQNYMGQLDNIAYIDLTELPLLTANVEMTLTSADMPPAGWQSFTIEYAFYSDNKNSQFCVDLIESSGNTQSLIRSKPSTNTDSNLKWQTQTLLLFSNLPFKIRIRVSIDIIQQVVPFAAIRSIQMDSPLDFVNSAARDRLSFNDKGNKVTDIRCDLSDSICDWNYEGDLMISSRSNQLRPNGLPPYNSLKSESAYMLLNASAKSKKSLLTSPVNNSAVTLEKSDLFCASINVVFSQTNVESEILINLVSLTGDSNRTLIYIKSTSQSPGEWRRTERTFYTDHPVQIQIVVKVSQNHVGLHRFDLQSEACEQRSFDLHCDFEQQEWCGMHSLIEDAPIQRIEPMHLPEIGNLITDHSSDSPIGHVLAVVAEKSFVSSEEHTYELLIRPLSTEIGLIRFWMNPYCEQCYARLLLRSNLSRIHEDEVTVWSFENNHRIRTWIPFEVWIQNPNFLKNSIQWLVMAITIQTNSRTNFVIFDDFSLSSVDSDVLPSIPALPQCDTMTHCSWINYSPKNDFKYFGLNNVEVVLQKLGKWIPNWASVYEPDFKPKVLPHKSKSFLTHFDQSDAVVLQSPTIHLARLLNDQFCLHLQLYRSEDNNFTEFFVLIGSTLIPNDHWHVATISMDKVPVNQWSDVFVNIFPHHLNKYPLLNYVNWYVMLPALNAEQKYQIAITKVNLYSAQCESFDLDQMILNRYKSIQCLDQMNELVEVEPEKICNFRNDCLNGQDEHDCSDCDFKNGFCGYQNAKHQNENVLDWVYGQLADFSTSMLYIVDDKNSSDLINTSGDLFSSILHDSHHTCFVLIDTVQQSSGFRLSLHVRKPDNNEVLWWSKQDAQPIANAKTYRLWLGAIDGAFRVRLSIEPQSSRDLMFGLKRIEFDDCARPTIVNKYTGCSVDEFKCRSGACVSKSNRCDLINDCGDRSDEIDCQYPPTLCDFEQNTCDWKLSASGVRTMAENTADQSAITRDHTINTPKGHYLLFNGDLNVSTGNRNSVSVSGMQVHMHGDQCSLSFFMICSMCKVTVSLNCLSTNSEHILKSHFQSEQDWTPATIDLNHRNRLRPNATFQISIEIQPSLQSALVALDDIRISGQCSTARPNDIACSFADRDNLFCDWYMDSSSSLNVLKISASSSDFIKTHPYSTILWSLPVYWPNDNGCIAFEFEQNQNQYELISARLTNRGQMWVSFWYSIVGVDPVELSLSLRTSGIDEGITNTRYMFRTQQIRNTGVWNQACVPLHVLPYDQLVLNAKTSTPGGFVLLQNFIASSKFCDIATNNFKLCHFDDYNVKSCDQLIEVFGWTAQSALKTMLHSDHTLHTPIGGVLVSSSVPKDSSSTISPMKSYFTLDLSSYSEPVCFGIWYTRLWVEGFYDWNFDSSSIDPISFNSNSTKLIIETIGLSGDSDKTLVLIESSGNHLTEWNWFEQSFGSQVNQVRVIVTSDSDEMRFAVDDISITSGLCISSITCNFDQPGQTCGWLLSHQLTEVNSWVQTTPKQMIRRKLPAPLVDVSSETDVGGILVTYFGQSNSQKSALLRTIRYPSNDFNQCFTFYYWTSQSQGLRLKVYQPDALHQQISINLKNNTIQEWQKASITLLQPALTNQAQEIVIGVFHEPSKSKADYSKIVLAIDQIELNDGSCDQLQAIYKQVSNLDQSKTEAIIQLVDDRTLFLNQYAFYLIPAVLLVICITSVIASSVIRQRRLRTSVKKTVKRAVNRSERVIYHVQSSNIYESIKIK